jgi:hypothetical protein
MPAAGSSESGGFRLVAAGVVSAADDVGVAGEASSSPQAAPAIASQAASVRIIGRRIFIAPI